MSNASLIDHLQGSLDGAVAGAIPLPQFQKEFEADVEAIEGLPWQLLKRGRELAHSILVESWHDAEQFDCAGARAKLFAEVREWIVAVRQADDLSAALEAVHDEETFLQFLLALRDDREAAISQEKVTPSSPYGAEARDWQNTTIERFFDTAVRWARDSANGNPFYKRPDNPWRRCADILFAAIGYE
jgi:hypothetical protein